MTGARVDFRTATIEQLVLDIRARRVSARELTDAALSNIERCNPTINAFCATAPDDARAEADRVDAALSRGDAVGALAGIPCGVKDLEDARGYVTTYGSALHVGDSPATEDSALVARLRAAGAIIVGKTNTPEFGFKGVTDNRPFGASRNPWDLDYTSGGSSGGSSAAIGAGMVPLATGSDGGGSIRIPSALCGFTGIKSSQGRVPLGGPNPPGSGVLSVKGPMALRCRDIALCLDATIGDEPTDIFGLPDPQTSLRSALDRNNRPAKVIWSPTMGFANVDTEIMQRCSQAIEQLADQGVEVIVNDDIWQVDPVFKWFQLWAAARAESQGPLRGTPAWEQIDDELKVQIEYGLDQVSGVDYHDAINASHQLNWQLEQAFADAPLILTPATCGRPPKIGSSLGTVNGEELAGWVAFTYGINMTRNPAGVVSCGTVDGLPVALQVIGRQREDASVLQALCYVEDLLQRPHNAPHGVVD